MQIQKFITMAMTAFSMLGIGASINNANAHGNHNHQPQQVLEQISEGHNHSHINSNANNLSFSEKLSHKIDTLNLNGASAQFSLSTPTTKDMESKQRFAKVVMDVASQDFDSINTKDYVTVNGFNTSLNSSESEKYQFMKNLLGKNDIVALFADSPKKDNLQILVDNKIAPISLVYKMDTCLIQGVMNDHVDLSIDVPEQYKEKLSFSPIEKSLNNELIARHEISHCRFSDFANPYILSEDTKLNHQLNQLWGTSTDNVIRGKINENFADTLAAMQMLKDYPTQDTKNMIYKHIALREATSIKEIDMNEISTYSDVYKSLKLLMTKEGLEKLDKINVNDGASMEKYALELANTATRISLSEMNKDKREMLFGSHGLESSKALGNVLFENNPTAFDKSNSLNLGNHKNLFVHQDSIVHEAAKFYLDELKHSPTEYNNLQKVFVKIGEKTQASLTSEEKNLLKNHQTGFVNKYNELTQQFLGDSVDNITNKINVEYQKKYIPHELEASYYSPNKIAEKLQEHTEENIKQMETNPSFIKIPLDLSARLEKLQAGFKNTENDITSKLRKLKI